MSIEPWELVREQDVEELNSRVVLYRHRRTGAELLSVENGDPNKCFAVTLRTLPGDSTGVAHILEHIVLGGSRKYALKDPFFSLIQGSLNTFLNAMTGFDRTIYPVASTNLQDFYNLVDVYLDSVFHPLLRPDSFKQEGWHYEASGEGELSLKGVVFNEMKAVWSMPDQLLGYTYATEALYPDTPYAYNSGGDPRVIPELTHQQLTAFHRTFYHPSNAQIMFWGDDPPEQRLRLVDQYLVAFDAQPVDAMAPLQAPFDAPRRAGFSYDSGAGEGKAYVAVGWVLPELDSPETALAVRILDYILWGTPAAPLRKALLDSGLGEDVVGGLETDIRQPMYLIGLKGVEEQRADAVEPLIMSTLEALARDGVDPDAVAAALNSVEFGLRELKFGEGYNGLPRGLAALFGLLGGWHYRRDPIAALAFAAPLEAVRSRAEHDPRYFSALIERLLLDNPHRSTLELQPDPEFNTRMAGDERAKLVDLRESMDDEQVQAIAAAARELEAWQSTPDAPELYAALPMLEVGDLESKNRLIETREEQLFGVRTLTHAVAGGIAYVDLGLDLQVLPAELLPYASIMGRLLLETGAGDWDAVKLTQRIGRETGGISSELLSAMTIGAARAETRLFLRGKVLADRSAALGDILRDVLFHARLDNRDRVRQIVLEEKAAREAEIGYMGTRFAIWRATSRINQAGYVTENTRGVGSLFFLRALAERIDGDWPAVRAELERVRELLLHADGIVLSVAVDPERVNDVLDPLAQLVGDTPAGSPPAAQRPALEQPRDEGLAVPAQVNYVGRGADLYSLGYRLHGSALVAESLLGIDWLLNEVRLKGGAYGAGSAFDRRSGVWNYYSYRDPRVRPTLEVFDRSGEFLRSAPLGEAELTRVIIGAIRDHDPYLAPDEQGYAALTRILTGDTDELRQRLRDEILNTTAADVRAFADALDLVRQHGSNVVLGGQTALRAAGLAITPVL